jgi:PKD repeat protein
MRVIYTQSVAAPCFTAPAIPGGAFYSGEVEDYDVNIVAGGAATPPVANFTVPVSVCKNQTITLNDNSTNTPTAWSWSLTSASPATSTLQNPAVSYANAGTYTISLISTNASGASAIVSKTIEIGECTGIETNNPQTENLVSVFPNPSTGYYVVNLTNAAEITIFNILGQKVITKLLLSGKSTIDLSNQPNGVYSLIIGNTAKRQNVKLIKE